MGNTVAHGSRAYHSNSLNLHGPLTQVLQSTTRDFVQVFKLALSFSKRMNFAQLRMGRRVHASVPFLWEPDLGAATRLATGEGEI
jgi:hypothetical protein